MKAADLLAEAAALVSGDRHKTHGDARENHQNIADLWTAYLGGQEITARDVALMMALVKIARTKTGTHNVDDYRDLLGYGAIAGELAEAES